MSASLCFLKRAALCLLLCSPALGTEQIVVFGDSLSKEYQVEFANLNAFNWIEILNRHRHDEFDIGSFSVFPDFRASGHEYNWSYPGATSWQMYENLTKSGFFQEIAQKQAEKHVKGTANRVLLMLGGNDIDAYYDDIYNGGDPTLYINRSYNNLERILKWIRARNATVPLVIANTPHIGATPRIKHDFPPDPVKTQRATDAISTLNARLRQLANDMGIGYADIYTITYDLLLGKPLVVSGMKFLDDSDNSGKTENIWLGGIGGRFHPNTIGQAMIANAIIEAFNRRYGGGIDPLGGSEIVGGLLERTVDLPFAQWIASYPVGPATGPDDDPDYDGFSNLEEFALDQDPTKVEPDFLALQPMLVGAAGAEQVKLRYRPRVEVSSHLSATVEYSLDLLQWVALGADQLKPDQNGYLSWQGPPATRGVTFFTRLRARLPQ